MFKNKKITILMVLGLLIIVGAVLRFYGHSYSQRFNFLNDEARDAFTIKQSLENQKPFYLGPEISLESGVHLGHFYYWLIAPAYLIGGFQPIMGAILIILFSVASIPLIYLVGRLLYSETAGIVAAVLFALSKTLIEYNWAWNPNPLPFFVLIYIILAYYFFIKKKEQYWILLGIILGLLTQLHLVAGIFILLTFILMLCYKTRFQNIKTFLYGILAFFLTYLPFIAYELSHHFKNLRGYWHIFYNSNSASGGLSFNFPRAVDLLAFFNGDFFTGQASFVLATMIIAAVLYYLLKTWRQFASRLILLSLLLLFLSIAVLKSLPVYWHYLLAFLPLLILGFAFFVQQWWQSRIIILRMSAIIVLSLVVFFNLKAYGFWLQDHLPATKSSDIRYQDAAGVVDFITQDSQGEEFNLVFTPGAVANNLTYEYLLVLKREEVHPDANLVYQIVQPKTVDVGPIGNGKIISEKIIGEVKIIKISFKENDV